MTGKRRRDGGEKTEGRRGKEEKNGRHLIYTHARERGEGIYIRSIYIGEREETGYSRNRDREETGRRQEGDREGIRRGKAEGRRREGGKEGRREEGWRRG